jgi:GT2 family glycosyltransferase
LSNKILFITVNFNTPRDTEWLVSSVRRQRGCETTSVVVVDNSPRPDGQSAVQLAGTPAGWEVAVPGDNIGYFGAARWAFERHRRRHGIPEWTVVCNPDIEFLGDDLLEQLAEIGMDRPPAVLAPSVLSLGHGRDENPYLVHRPSAARMHFYKAAFRWRCTSLAFEATSWTKRAVQRRRSRLFAERVRDSRPREIYAGHGCCMILHQRFFEAGGHLRHGCFLFGEEIFVAEQSREAGLRTVYDPRVRARHRGRASAGMMWDPIMLEYLRDSAAYIANEFFPR